MYVQQRCILGEDETGCGALAVAAVSFRDNVAAGGGGGVLFQAWHNLTNVTCAGATTQLQPQQLSTGCRCVLCVCVCVFVLEITRERTADRGQCVRC